MQLESRRTLEPPVSDQYSPAQTLSDRNSSTIQPLEPVTIEVVGESMREAWDGFLRNRPGASFYHLHDWSRINSRFLGHESHYLAARRGGVIVGILPLVMVRSRLFGRILCSMPFVNYGGPVAEDESIALQLAQRAAELAAGLRADYLELRCATPLATDMPVSLRKVSLTVELQSDPEALFNSFSQKHRKNVRRAQKNGLEVIAGGIELLDDFYDVLQLSWRDLGTPIYSKEYFRAVVEAFPNNTRLYSCRSGKTPVSAAMVGMHEGTVEGMWAGTRADMRNLQSNYVIYWEMLRDTCVSGQKLFHLGRSTADSGAEQFKSKWNAQSHQLYWYFHRPRGGDMPGLNVDNPKYRLAIAAWRRLPLWVTRAIGPHIARGIP